MKRYLVPFLFFLALMFAFNIGGCNSNKVTGMAFVSCGGLTDYMAVSRSGSDGKEFILYSSDAQAAAGQEVWTEYGVYRGELVGMGQNPQENLLVFRDGAVMSVSLDSVKPAAAADAEIADTPTAAQKGVQGKTSNAPAIRKLATIVEGSGDFNFVDASVSDTQALAVSMDDSHMPHLFVFEQTETESMKWKEIPARLPLLSVPAIVRCGYYQDSPVFFWRESSNGFPLPGLRGIWLRDGVWEDLPMVSKPLLKGNFAIAPYGQNLLLVQQPTFSQSKENKVYVNLLEQKGWSAFSKLKADNALQGIGGGISLSTSGGYALLALSSVGEVQAYKSSAVQSGNWRKYGASGSEQGGAVPTWYFFVLLGLSAVAMMLTWRATKMRMRMPDGKPVGDAALELSRLSHGKPATLVIRAVAMFIDWALVLPLPMIYIGVSLDGVDFDHLLKIAARGDIFVLYFLSLGGLALYSMIAEGLYGQTIGKKLLGLKVRSFNGNKVSWKGAVLRNLLRAVDFFPVPVGGTQIWYLVAFVSAAFSRNRQRVGDMLASTVVLRFLPLKKRRIVLASASPRRRELLQEMGYEFEVQAADVDESIIEGIEPVKMAMMLAGRKAQAVALKQKSPAIIIAADTIVVDGEKILGKPESEENAAAMLRSLSGKDHRVITAVSVLDLSLGATLEGADITTVHMRELSDFEIETYVETGEPMDKAGAYAIQGRGGDFVTEISGSLSNVIGLPVEMLSHILSEIE